MQFEPRPREFAARMTRRSRARAVAAAKGRRNAGRRATLLALAIAAPAFAAPVGWTNPPEAAASAPRAAATPNLVPLPRSPAITAPAMQPDVQVIAAVPAARPLFAAGTSRDRARAQHCLTQAIYYEAASESDAGQRAVAQVVLNRVAHPAWPDTVCGVVFQGSERATGCQFTFTCDGSLMRQPSRRWWDRAARVARAALAGAVHAPVGLATHYHTLQVDPYWAASLTPVDTIGAHRFYRWSGANGRPAAFTAVYGGREPQATPPRPAILPTAHTFQTAAAGIGAPEQPAAHPAQGPAPMPVADSLPTSGTVRPEYARSGQWIARP